MQLDKFRVLFEGHAQRTKDNSVTKHGEEIYSVTANEITFALVVRGFIPYCGHKVIKTEHPKLFIVDKSNGDFFAEKKKKK